MPKPCDEFAVQLAKLRIARGMAAKDLSRAVGKSHGYINGWERSPQPINKRILHKACQALQLGEGERLRLFHLADQRVLPPEQRADLTSVEQMLLNVLQALAEIEREHPDNLTATSLQAAIACASWLFPSYAAVYLQQYSPACLAWPEQVFDKRLIKPDRSKRDSWHKLPHDLVEQELPGLERIDSLTPDVVFRMAGGLASVYRRWLLSDLDRCREIARGLRRWSLTDEPAIGPVGTFVFQDVDHQHFNVPEIRCSVARCVLRRDFTGYLYDAFSGALEDDQLRDYPYAFEPVDSFAIGVVKFARRYLRGGPARLVNERRQDFHDALFVLRSNAWHSRHAIRAYVHLLAQEDEDEGLIEAAAKANDDELVSLSPKFAATRINMTSSLESAAREIDRQAALAEVAKSPQAAARATAKTKKRAKRRQANKKTTKKRASRGAAKGATKPATTLQRKGKRKR